MTIVLNIELFSNKNVKKLIKDVKEEEVMRILAQLIENQKNYLNYKNNCCYCRKKMLRKEGENRKENGEEENIIRGGKKKNREEERKRVEKIRMREKRRAERKWK